MPSFFNQFRFGKPNLGSRKGKSTIVTGNTPMNVGTPQLVNQFKSRGLSKLQNRAAENKTARNKRKLKEDAARIQKMLEHPETYTEENVQRMMGISNIFANKTPRLNTYGLTKKNRQALGKSHKNYLERSITGVSQFPVVNTSNMTPQTAYTENNAERMLGVSNLAQASRNAARRNYYKAEGENYIPIAEWLAQQREGYKFPLVNTSNMTPRTSYTASNLPNTNSSVELQNLALQKYKNRLAKSYKSVNKNKLNAFINKRASFRKKVLEKMARGETLTNEEKYNAGIKQRQAVLPPKLAGPNQRKTGGKRTRRRHPKKRSTRKH